MHLLKSIENKLTYLLILGPSRRPTREWIDLTIFCPLISDPENSFTKSLFWPNEATFQGHPRFKTLTQNIRQRRREKVIVIWDRHK